MSMIYLLEDDDGIRNFVIYALKSGGFSAEGFPLPSEFFAAVSKRIPDLCLLDIMLPEEDGLSVLKKLKSNPETKSVPVIMLTAKTTEYDKVIGLDGGADDYVSKPFGTMELISRVRAVLRRSGATDAGDAKSDEYRVGGLYVCPSKHIVKSGGADVILTLKEFKLLCYLLEGDGAVRTRDRILEEVWGYSYFGENRTVDVHIRTLRQKLGSDGNVIETVKGIGYKIGSISESESESESKGDAER